MKQKHLKYVRIAVAAVMFVLFFGVDLNGNKKPNRLGYDIFIFSNIL